MESRPCSFRYEENGRPVVYMRDGDGFKPVEVKVLRITETRVVLDNPKLAWRPGLFVDVDVVTGAAEVPVAVEKDALQVLNETRAARLD